MSQIEKSTILNERPVMFLITPEVSALQINMLASNKILTCAPQVAVRDKNVECKQRKTYANRGENHTEVITSHQSANN